MIPLNVNEFHESVALAKASNEDMLWEVVHSAFKHKEEFPEASFLQCLQVGLDEWNL